MPTLTASLLWAHLAVAVRQDIMAMDWNALVRKCSAQSLAFVHSYRFFLEHMSSCNDVLDFNLDIEIVALLICFFTLIL